MPIVTVLTPTYNRRERLKDLYESLLKQSSKDFVWLIVDDGSTDRTEETVIEWKNRGFLKIIYKKKSNGGKHTALNYSYQFIDTPLTFIVDSDDTLTENAIALIEEKYNQYKNESDLCGFSFLRSKKDGGYLSSSGVPINGLKESYCECRINRNIQGDMAEVWFTHCLKEYCFPEFEDEKFLGEDLVWVQMSEKYKLRFYNQVIYISDYLNDGLTNNRRKHNINSPKGCVARAEAFLNSKVILKIKIKSMLQYIIYGRFAKYKQRILFDKTNKKFLYFICFLPAMLIYNVWSRKKEN